MGKTFLQYFGQLLHFVETDIKPNMNKKLPIDSNDFSLEGLNVCLKLFKNKLPRPNNVHAECLKSNGLLIELSDTYSKDTYSHYICHMAQKLRYTNTQ